MAGFSPVGSFPVASAPAGLAGVSYTIDPAELTVEGFTFSTTGSTVVISPARVALLAAETILNAPALVRVASIWAETIRTVTVAGRKRAAQIIG